MSGVITFQAFTSNRNLFHSHTLSLQRKFSITRMFYLQSSIGQKNPIYAKDIDIYENEELLSEDDDSEIEDAMALETFLELSFNTGSLSEQAFLEWEDIQEVLCRGFVDRETMMIIMKEVGIKGGFMNFIQFKDVVELVNQVSTTLEQNSLNDEDDEEVFDDELTKGSLGGSVDVDAVNDDDDSTAKWIEAQLNKMDRS